MWAAPAATYCPSRAGELPKQKMTKSHVRWDGNSVAAMNGFKSMLNRKLTVDEVVEAANEEVLASALGPPPVGIVVGVPDRLPHAQPGDRQFISIQSFPSHHAERFFGKVLGSSPALLGQ